MKFNEDRVDPENDPIRKRGSKLCSVYAGLKGLKGFIVVGHQPAPRLGDWVCCCTAAFFWEGFIAALSMDRNTR